MQEFLSYNRMPIYWGLLSFNYIFLIGISSGLMFLTGFDLRRGVERPTLLKYMAAMAIGLASATSLIMELLQPTRAVEMLYRPHLSSSAMAWGSVLLNIYFISGLAGFYFIYRHRKVSKVLAYFIILSSFLLMSYVGMEMGLALGRTLWHTSFTVFNIFLLNLVSGAAVYLIVDIKYNGGRDSGGVDVILLLQAVLVMIGLNLILAEIFDHYVRLLGEVQLVPLVLGLVLGIAVLLAVLSYNSISKASKSNGSIIAVAGVSVLVGVALLKWSIFIGGQEIPRTVTVKPGILDSTINDIIFATGQYILIYSIYWMESFVLGKKILSKRTA